MFIKRLSSYIAVDRRIALIGSKDLASKSPGTTLFVDISGYTKLTEAFVTEHGTLQGADRMTHWLNQVYDCLIEQIHRFGGSVVGFSGDAMTCWLNDDSGIRACAAAVAMRRAIVLLSKECLKEENVGDIGIKVSLASGVGQRLCVGDPKYRLYDLLAGRILEHAAKGEGLAGRDEIVLHESTLEGVRNEVSVEELNSPDDQRYYRLTKIKAKVPS
ncbi:MAG: adenylate/guanylate cyclase domain-containing protein, partial [Planctomycetota bacterium]|nr:adenylate/guanylate cyclase domain-containing protein [Planctomycetota bacterium]